MPLPQPITTLHHIVHNTIATGMHNTTEDGTISNSFFTRKKIGFTIYVILSQLCVNCRADADAVILHHNSGLGDMITILTMHRATMHHYLTVNCIIFNCSTSMHCEPLCSISSSALLATDELFICTVSIYVWWLNNTVQRHISALHIHCKGSYDWLNIWFVHMWSCVHECSGL